MLVSVDIVSDSGRHCPACDLADEVRSPSAATTTPSSGLSTSGREDVELMREAGVTFVTARRLLLVLARARAGRVRLRPGSTRCMDLLHDNDIAVDLATATASPPPWLSAAHPEILPVDRDGHTLWPGSRQTSAPARPSYRDHALALVDAAGHSATTTTPRWPCGTSATSTPATTCPATATRCAVALPRLAARPLRRPSTTSTTPGAPRSGASATPTGSRSCRRGARPPSRNPTHQLDYRGSAPTPCSTSTARRRRSCTSTPPASR